MVAALEAWLQNTAHTDPLIYSKNTILAYEDKILPAADFIHVYENNVNSLVDILC